MGKGSEAGASTALSTLCIQCVACITRVGIESKENCRGA